jgi:hypothetical protein
MTPEDLQQIAAIVTTAEQRITTGIAGEIKATEERAQETARNMQTEILRGIEAFARGNFARTDADTNERITALE